MVSESEVRGELEPLCEVVMVPMPLLRWSRAILAPLFGRSAQVAYYRSAELRRQLTEVVQRFSPDAAVIQLVRMAPYEKVLRAHSRAPVVLDLVDSLALNWTSLAEHSSPPVSWVRTLEAWLVGRFEQQVLPRFDAITVVAEADRTFLGHPRVVVNPLGVESDRPVVPVTERDSATLIYFGNMSYPPNVQAVTELVREVVPRVRSMRPEVRVRVVGAAPSRAVRALADDAVEVTGYVPDLQAELGRATLAVFPLRSGSGMHGKVLEALAAGLPVIATPFVLGGVRAAAGVELEVGDVRGQAGAARLDLVGRHGCPSAAGRGRAAAGGAALQLGAVCGPVCRRVASGGEVGRLMPLPLGERRLLVFSGDVVGLAAAASFALLLRAMQHWFGGVEADPEVARWQIIWLSVLAVGWLGVLTVNGGYQPLLLTAQRSVVRCLVTTSAVMAGGFAAVFFVLGRPVFGTPSTDPAIIRPLTEPLAVPRVTPVVFLLTAIVTVGLWRRLMGRMFGADRRRVVVVGHGAAAATLVREVRGPR